MRLSSNLSALLCTILLLLNCVVPAFETDQFNLPKTSLADIGDEVSEHVIGILRDTVSELNAEIQKSTSCIELRKKGFDDAVKEKARLEKLQRADTLVKHFFDRISGGNLMTTKFGMWMNEHKFAAQPARYKAPYKESIYVLNPLNYATLSPTVRLYGHEFGIDKLEHLFQQGYRYHTIYKDEITEGGNAEQAAQKAIKWGQKTERTYYGLLTSGVYSNADLFANYAGLKFYQGLTEPLDIGKNTRPALVHLSNGHWKINEEAIKESILKPFITDHLNEALNASSYRPTLLRSVRRSVTKYACPQWRNSQSDLQGFDLALRSKAVEVWNGENYGFSKRDRTVTLANTCFTP